MSYETPEQTNARLYRPILDGRKYEKLFPKSNCKRIDGGKGNTEYSVNQMNEVVRLYSKQTTSTAQTLKKSSLVQTAQEIQNFLYWHFQYKRDLEDQILRSPACSFHQRQDGIDCKSYSILAASILHELGYKSYFRRVSYQPNQPYGHVYVVVPKNQKTANLSEGYYTIDGTLNIQVGNEPTFFKKSDLPVMDKMNHYILNAPQPTKGLSDPKLGEYEKLYLYQRGLSGYMGLGNSEAEQTTTTSTSNKSSSGFNFGKVFDFIKDINFKKLFSNIDCWGGSAYTGERLEQNLRAIMEIVNKDVSEINNLLQSKNYIAFSRKVRELKVKIRLLGVVFVKKKASKSWNSCSNKAFDKTISFLNNELGTVVSALDAWIDEFFNKNSEPYEVVVTQPKNSPDRFLGIYIWGTALGETYTETDASFRYTFSPKLSQTIPFFEMTVDLDKALNDGGKNFNPTEFLNNLLDTATIFYSSGSAQGGQNPSTGSQNPSSGGSSISPQGSGSTAKMAFGGALVIAAIALGASQFKNKSTK